MTTPSSSVRRSPAPDPSFAGIRRYSRREIELEVVVQDDDGWEIALDAVDVSPVGMFVESDLLFDVGDEHTLIFRAPDDDFLFRVRGRVTRVSTGQGPDDGSRGSVPGMAYEFVDPDGDTWTKLCAVVAEH